MSVCPLRSILKVLILFGALCSPQVISQSWSQNGKLPLVDLKSITPSIVLDIRYCTTQNFMGKRVEGYEASRCLLTRSAALALKAVQADLQKYGLSLKVYDCYRPQRAVDHFVRWARDLKDIKMKADYYPHVAKNVLFAEGYIAARSGHSRGSTVDLTINGLDMGTPWDFFGSASHTRSPSVSLQARIHRMLLVSVMRIHGFTNYSKEWWHFTWQPEVFPDTYFDIPISTRMNLKE